MRTPPYNPFDSAFNEDIYLVKDTRNIRMFSINGVPYPLNEYHKLLGKPTDDDIAEVIRRWK